MSPPKKSAPIKSAGKSASKQPGSGQSAARSTPSAAAKPRVPVFWIGVGVVVVLGIVGIVFAASSGGGSKSSSNGGGSSSQLEFGKVTVEGKALPTLPDTGPDPAKGETAPILKGENFQGEPVTIAPAGKPRMVVFLAHWCPHCNAEAPRLAAYLADAGMPTDADLTIVPTGSNVDAPNWPPSQWVQDMKLGNVQTLVDNKRQTAALAYGLPGYPFIVLLDAQGKVIERRSGEQEAGYFNGAFQQLTASITG